MPVLIVDDNAAAREFLAALLADIGLAPNSVASGEAALEAARTTAFRVAFVDWQMPGLDGIETIRRLRTLEAPPRIVMVTALGQEKMLLDSIALGVKDFVVKPFAPERIITAVNKALS
jgi:two-component system sensor histidine kinase/response regulator